MDGCMPFYRIQEICPFLICPSIRKCKYGRFNDVHYAQIEESRTNEETAVPSIGQKNKSFCVTQLPPEQTFYFLFCRHFPV